MQKTVLAAVLVCVAVSGNAFAQAKPTAPAQPAAQAAAPANPITAGTKAIYEVVKGYITKAAEQVPESLYSFKATPDVRSLGQLFAHVADGNIEFCGPVSGGKAPAGDTEKTKTTKADIQKALAASFAYCDSVYASMTDAEGAKIVDLFGMKLPKLSILGFNTAHDFEHYGNIVTYMRLNKMVPPSSQGRGM